MSKLISYGGKRVPSGPGYMKLAIRIALVLLVAVLILLNLLTHVFMVERYYGSSMEPTLTDRKIIVLLKTDHVEQGDIVAFYYNNKILVRRIIADGGDTVMIDAAGRVSIDGLALDEPYVQSPSMGQCNLDFPYQVPYEHYFVMGDNRSVSMDSRLSEIGAVPADRMIGKMLFAF